MVLCCLKRYFDAQRIDAAGYSAVRTQKAIIILWMLSIFFALSFFYLIALGATVFIPVLFIFPIYWLILAIGFRGARTRSPKLLFTFFISKAFFELALLCSLSLLFLSIGIFSIAESAQEHDKEGAERPAFHHGHHHHGHHHGHAEVQADRQFANPSQSYAPDENTHPSSDSTPVTDQPDVDTGRSTDTHPAVQFIFEFLLIMSILALLFTGALCFAGFLHFITTLAALILAMRTFCLLKKAQVLPLSKKPKKTKKAKKAKKTKTVSAKISTPSVTPSVYVAPESAQQMYASAPYQPMVYVVPMPAQE